MAHAEHSYGLRQISSPGLQDCDFCHVYGHPCRIDWQTMKKQKGKPRLPLQGPNAICAFGLFRFCCPTPIHSGIECSSVRTNGKATKNHEKCETDLQFPKTGVWYVCCRKIEFQPATKQRRLEDDQQQQLQDAYSP